MKIDLWQTQRDGAQVLDCGLKVLRCSTVSGKPSVMIWRPKAIKPQDDYMFKSEEERDKFIQSRVDSFLAWQKQKEEYKASRRGSEAQLELVQVGFIFHFSWGYDQTNNNYYQVVAKNGRMLTLREIGQRSLPAEGCSPMSDYRIPVKDAFVEGSKPFEKRLQFSQGKPYVTMASYGWCSLWDGKKDYCSWYA